MGIPFSIFLTVFGVSLLIFRARFVRGAMESQREIFGTGGKWSEKVGHLMVIVMGSGMALLGILGIFRVV
ncbi:hypothetical protein V1J52_11060 [Streptomyces sp. TRM 70351]|uniref:hypothetical protein n=1 Tax=Streptomyces sp. TRM 70351 TaxID=3116552 RepID=UPI002E7B0C96|nr:hypothetical protein [Streptomyces sp. TRM 70351]MEE1928728.1 hypothetical protein [Streptomyces sp. TRM 70351]